MAAHAGVVTRPSYVVTQSRAMTNAACPASSGAQIGERRRRGTEHDPLVRALEGDDPPVAGEDATDRVDGAEPGVGTVDAHAGERDDRVPEDDVDEQPRLVGDGTDDVEPDQPQEADDAGPGAQPFGVRPRPDAGSRSASARHGLTAGQVDPTA